MAPPALRHARKTSWLIAFRSFVLILRTVKSMANTIEDYTVNSEKTNEHDPKLNGISRQNRIAKGACEPKEKRRRLR